MKSKYVHAVVALLLWLIVGMSPVSGISIPGDSSVGTWNPDTRTFTLTTDVSETIQINEDNLPLVSEGGRTPEQAIVGLTGIVEDMDLPRGIENSLLANLDNALEKLEDSNPNNDGAAINNLEAFINKIEAQAGKKLTEEQAGELVIYAAWIIAELGGP